MAGRRGEAPPAGRARNGGRTPVRRPEPGRRCEPIAPWRGRGVAMSPLIARRVRWCAAVAARLFRGDTRVATPAAWSELLRDPAALSEARWAPLLGLRTPGDAPGESAGQASGTAVSAHPPAAGHAEPRPAAAGAGNAAAFASPGPLHGKPVNAADPHAAAVPAARRAGVSPAGAPPPSARAGRRWPADEDRRAPSVSAAPLPIDGTSAPAPSAWRSAAFGGTVPASPPGRLAPIDAPAAAERGVPWPAAARVAGVATVPAPSPEAAHAAAPATRLVLGPAGLGRLMSLVPRHAVDTAGTPPGFGPVRQSAFAAQAVPTVDVAALRGAPSMAPAGDALDAVAPVVVAPPRPKPEPEPEPDAALHVDALLDALADRLRIDYLRHYGSAG